MQKKIARKALSQIVAAARLAPSAANLQFMEYLVVDNKILLDKIFPHTKWAGYLKGKGTPAEDQKPASYIVLLINTERSSAPDLRDLGASAQTILLSALCFGLGTCWIASIDKEALRRELNIPVKYNIDSIVALGYPKQKSKVTDSHLDVKYRLDARGNLIVPKRPLSRIIHFNKI